MTLKAQISFRRHCGARIAATGSTQLGPKRKAMLTRDKRSALVTATIISFVISTVLPAAAANAPTCNGDLSSTKVHGGIISAAAQKRWQPRGGEFTFVIDTPADIPADALVTVCFGWKRAGAPTDPKGFVESHPTRILKLEPDKKSLTIAATVPDLQPASPRFRGLGDARTEGQSSKLGV